MFRNTFEELHQKIEPNFDSKVCSMKARSMLVDVKVMMMFVVVRNGFSTPFEFSKHGVVVKVSVVWFLQLQALGLQGFVCVICKR